MRHTLSYLLLLFSAFCCSIYAQPYPQDAFSWPLEGVYRISGSFGAIRNNHFHSGLDISTSKKEGFAVKASAYGTVVRIKVSPFGYGKALYIDHPNGFTTVYAHLQRFSPEIERFVTAAQYNNKNFEVELFPPRGKFKFNKGDIIAYSGNTGGSTGPHLHFEIRDTKTEHPINPLLFGFRYIDSIAPDFGREYLLMQLNDAIKTETGHYPFAEMYWKRDSTGNIYDSITLRPGTYGIAADAFDYYNDPGLPVGINYLTLTEDDSVRFQLSIEHFHFDDTRFVNCHIPYAYYYQKGKRMHQAFVDDGNRMPFYSFTDQGKIRLKEGERKTIQLRINDLYDSTATATLYLKCEMSESIYWQSFRSADTAAYTFLCYPFEPNRYADTQVFINVPKKALYDTLLFRFNTYCNKWGTGINFLQKEVPLHLNMQVGLKYLHPDSSYIEKAVITSPETGGIGGVYENGFVTGKTRNFGNFRIEIDTLEPSIRGPWVSRRNVKAFIDDALSGIASYDVYIDNQWLLMEYDAKRKLLSGSIPAHIKAGKHELKFVVIDHKKNKKTLIKRFNLR